MLQMSILRRLVSSNSWSWSFRSSAYLFSERVTPRSKLNGFDVLISITIGAAFVWKSQHLPRQSGIVRTALNQDFGP
jgi:hypothetical protein